MRMIVVLGIIFICHYCCGDESPNVGDNSPPVVDHLVVPAEVHPGANIELQVVAHDADWRCADVYMGRGKRDAGFKDRTDCEMDGPFRFESSDCDRFCE